MPINAVLDVKEELSVYGYTEPVSIEELKQYAKIDFNDDDELIGTLLTTSRERLERYLGLSLVPKSLTVILNNEDGGIEIPYGPTPYDIDVSTILDIDGNVFEESVVVIIGNQFKYLQAPCYPYVQMSYQAGYAGQLESLTAGGIPIPTAIISAIKADCFFLYENRGERVSKGGDDYISYAAKQICNKYRRNTELSL